MLCTYQCGLADATAAQYDQLVLPHGAALVCVTGGRSTASACKQRQNTLDESKSQHQNSGSCQHTHNTTTEMASPLIPKSWPLHCQPLLTGWETNQDRTFRKVEKKIDQKECLQGWPVIGGSGHGRTGRCSSELRRPDSENTVSRKSAGHGQKE